MDMRDILELAFQRFRTRSLRFLLTIFGVSVGIGVVFFLVALGFGLQDVVIGRIVTSESLVTLTVAVADAAQKLLQINDQTLKDFAGIEHVQDTSPLLAVPAEVQYSELKAQTLIQGVGSSYFRYAGTKVAGGEFFKDDAVDQVVVSNTVFRLFGLSEKDAIGKEISLTFFFPKEVEVQSSEPKLAQSATPLPSTAPGASGDVNVVTFGHTYKIVGYIESENNSIYVPLKLFEGIPNHSYTEVRVRVDEVANIDGVRRSILDKGYSVVALTDTLDQLNRIFRITQISLGVLGVVALFISSVGMFNTLTISLLERTREVGILKAIGATNKDVWKIFLFEAVLIGFLGGVSGVLGGLVFARIVNYIINILARHYGGQPVNIFLAPAWFIISIISISLMVGFLTGLYPARRAAHLNPLDALRHE